MLFPLGSCYNFIESTVAYMIKLLGKSNPLHTAAKDVISILPLCIHFDPYQTRGTDRESCYLKSWEFSSINGMLTTYLHQLHTLCTVSGIKTPPRLHHHHSIWPMQVEFKTKENARLYMHVSRAVHVRSYSYHNYDLEVVSSYWVIEPSILDNRWIDLTYLDILAVCYIKVKHGQRWWGPLWD